MWRASSKIQSCALQCRRLLPTKSPPCHPVSADAGVMKLVRGAMTASAAGNAVMSGLMGACSTATDSDAAWALYQDACSYGYMLDDQAQQVLWDLQSGSRHLLMCFLLLVLALHCPGIMLPTSLFLSPVKGASGKPLAFAHFLFLHHTVLYCNDVAGL